MGVFGPPKLFVGLSEQPLDALALVRIKFLIQQVAEMLDVPPSNKPIHGSDTPTENRSGKHTTQCGVVYCDPVAA